MKKGNLILVLTVEKGRGVIQLNKAESIKKFALAVLREKAFDYKNGSKK